MALEITIIIAVFVAGLYMLGVGYRFLPNPGVNGSTKNNEYFNKYRKIFKAGGILSLVYVALQTIYLTLGHAQ